MSKSIFERAVAAASALGLLSVTAACGSSSGQGFVGLGGNTEAGGAPNKTLTGTTNDASLASGDDDSSGFAVADDGGAPPAMDCQPGTYTGTFDTKVVTDAGGFFSFFSIEWSGKLTIVLQGKTSSTGGELPTSTLTIAPGAKIDGMDAYNGTFVGDLSGQLDCPTRTLSGTLSNAEYLFYSSDASTLPLIGTFTGTYDNEGGTPVLNGALDITSPMAGGLNAGGTWNTTLQ